jgi:hypothetical protein
LIKEYQELFIKYKNGDHKQRVEELIDLTFRPPIRK